MLVTIILMKTRILLIPIFITLFFTSSVAAEVYSYGKDTTVIGVTTTYKVKDNESLIEIARKFGIGFNEIADSNPDHDPFVPGAGMSVKIPTSWILPDIALYNGIVINLSELRLYYFLRQRGTILIHGTNKPYGVGRRVSHGCIRLYPEDIPKLFQSVPNGVSVTIARQPVKVGIKNNKVYIEVHKDKFLHINYFNEA